MDKAADDPDHTSAPTRSKYRKILAELEPLHDPDDDRRPLEVVGGARNGGRRQRATGVRKALVALAVAGSALAGGATHQRATEAASGDQGPQSGAENGSLDRTARARRARRALGRAA
ncbi:MAG TPA: hypothetical protein VJ931_09140 [Actinomycetota bacterium]|nr:hypothetical protein [Actinomycetota bacterium]